MEKTKISSGTPLAEMKSLTEPASLVRHHDERHRHPVKDRMDKDLRSPGSIIIVRNRMLYARAAWNAKGQVRFGMRHIRRPNHPSAIHLLASFEPRGLTPS